MIFISDLERTKGIVRQFVLSTQNCRKCTMQKFTSSPGMQIRKLSASNLSLVVSELRSGAISVRCRVTSHNIISMLGLCDGMLMRNVYDKVADDMTAYEKMCCVRFDGSLIPFGAKVSYKRQGCTNVARRIRYVWGGWSGALLIADCDDFENLSASNIHIKSFTQKLHKKRLLSFPCADGCLNLFNVPKHHATKCSPGEILSKMKQKKRIPFSKKNTTNILEHDIKYRHDEVHRKKMDILEEKTFLHSNGMRDEAKREQASITTSNTRRAIPGMMIEKFCSQRDGLEELITFFLKKKLPGGFKNG